MKRPNRSAELHSAVSQICNLQGGESTQDTQIFPRTSTIQSPSPVPRPAECNSAVRQISNLRYGLRIAALLAVLAPFTLQAYLVGLPDGMDKMTTNSDLILKARVISSTTITNAAFQPVPGFQVQASTLEVLSILKGQCPSKTVVFQHYASHPDDRMGRMYAPQHYDLEDGHCYLMFAARTEQDDVFRQIRMHHTSKEDEGVMRTLDDRPLSNMTVKDAHWFELGLLLNNLATTNQLYAIQQLDSMSGNKSQSWHHADNFNRADVLKILQPLITHTNDEVAIAALNCFKSGPDGTGQDDAYAEALTQITTCGAPTSRWIAAIDACSGARFPVVSNALSRWLTNASDEVRLHTVLLLPSFPGEFSERALRERATDPSPSVRAGVADAIGNGKIVTLLPLLKTLFTDPVGRTNPVPPLSLEQLQDGGRIWGGNNGDVHTSAGYALLQFDTDQVGDFLASNLNDPGFRPAFLCKLAETHTAPWLTNLVEMLEQRRVRIEKEVEVSGVPQKKEYLKARLTLSGNAFKCWNILYGYLHELPPEAFANGKMNRTLDAMERAGTTGSQEPMRLYELYRTKGLPERAAKYRQENNNQAVGFDIELYYNRVDAQMKAP
jgi:hypothetical protein